jgi:hypothetical protein
MSTQGIDQSAHDGLIHQIKALVSYIAAALGIGTFAGVVNIAVGLLSVAWLLYQFWMSVKYDLPVKRAKAKAAKQGRFIENTDHGDLR